MVDDQTPKTDASSPVVQSSAVSPCSTRSSSSGSNSSHSTPSAYSHRKSKSSGATPSAATTSAWSSGVRSPSSSTSLPSLPTQAASAASWAIRGARRAPAASSGSGSRRIGGSASGSPSASLMSMSSNSKSSATPWELTWSWSWAMGSSLSARGRARDAAGWLLNLTTAATVNVVVNGCRSRCLGRLPGCRLLRGEQGPEHVLHDAAVPVVVGLAGGVDAHGGGEALAVGGHRDLGRHGPLVERLDALDVEDLLAGQAEGLGAVARLELEREHAHADQVGPVDALERLDQHGADAEQRGALRRPVARGTRAVLLAADDDERGSLFYVGTGRVVDRHLLAVLLGDAAFGAGGELVAEPDVGERSADHHLVVTAAGAVGVEVLPVDAVLAQVQAGRGGGLERAGRRDVVGGDRVAELGQDLGPVDVGHRRRLGRHAVEVGRPGDVG